MGRIPTSPKLICVIDWGLFADLPAKLWYNGWDRLGLAYPVISQLSKFLLSRRTNHRELFKGYVGISSDGHVYAMENEGSNRYGYRL